MKYQATLEEQAGVILFVALEDASPITGMTLPVKGGNRD